MSVATAFTVNGRPAEVQAAPATPLLEVLRNELGLKGTRFGCGAEQCGCCMVLVDGDPVYSCTRKVATIAGRSVLTIEGIGTLDRPHVLQQAFIDEQAGQCGYCLSGILVSAAALLARRPRPGRAEIAAALDRHLCRCGVHNRVMRALIRAAAAGASA